MYQKNKMKNKNTGIGSNLLHLYDAFAANGSPSHNIVAFDSHSRPVK